MILTSAPQGGLKLRSYSLRRVNPEVLLRSYLQGGSRFSEQLNGMFAVGTWDTVNEELVLACDSMGVKLPLRRPRDHRDWAAVPDVTCLPRRAPQRPGMRHHRPFGRENHLS
jgi:hypothetical protein